MNKYIKLLTCMVLLNTFFAGSAHAYCAYNESGEEQTWWFTSGNHAIKDMRKFIRSWSVADILVSGLKIAASATKAAVATVGTDGAAAPAAGKAAGKTAMSEAKNI